jgi:NUMOD1 domain
MNILGTSEGIPVEAYKVDGTFIGEYTSIAQACKKLLGRYTTICPTDSFTKSGRRRTSYSKIEKCRFYLKVKKR